MPPFSRRLSLKQTDATGTLYFAAQLELCLEAFEAFLQGNGLPLRALLEEKHFLTPIAHVDADYFLPLKVDDIIDVEIFLKSLGKRSFTLEFSLKKGKELAGRAQIVHVAVDKATVSSIDLPGELKALLANLPLFPSKQER